MVTRAPLDQEPAELGQLLTELGTLREKVWQNADARLHQFTAYFPDGRFSDSAANLASYLALRQYDLRPLQERLARAGLSSLGRGEAQILANLDRIIEILSRALGVDYDGPQVSGCVDGSRILNAHTDALFGPPPAARNVRIMVTLSTDAAWDYELVHTLMCEGMDCVRINCAHDDPQLWTEMVANVQRAERETGRRCRILMDLAGHKLRTGPVQAGPPVLHLKAERDEYGRVIAPAIVMLEEAGTAVEQIHGVPLEVRYRLPIPRELCQQLAVGDRLEFEDSRGKARHLAVVARTGAGGWLAECERSAWVCAGSEFDWCRRGPDGHYRPVGREAFGEFPGKPYTIRLFKDDALLLTREPLPGQPPQLDAAGEVEAPARISCSLPEVFDTLQVGDPVWLDDGKLGAVVERLDGQGALLRIHHAAPRGVVLRSDKGLNFPNTALNLPALSAKDLEDLEFVCRHADMVGFSFVESLADMECLLQALAERGAEGLPIIAKIETNRAVRNLPEIILGSIGRHQLGIMIARGDLSVELGSVRLAEIQEEILWVCEAAHVPVIWATQVLETMAKKGLRSRPEFTDAAMGVRAECVMLNKGPYIVDALRALSNVLHRMQDHQRKKSSRLRALHW